MLRVATMSFQLRKNSTSENCGAGARRTEWQFPLARRPPFQTAPRRQNDANGRSPVACNPQPLFKQRNGDGFAHVDFRRTESVQHLPKVRARSVHPRDCKRLDYGLIPKSVVRGEL